jgi:hypothetical protein
MSEVKNHNIKQTSQFIVFDAEIIESKSTVQQAGAIGDAIKKAFHIKENLVNVTDFQSHLQDFLGNIDTVLAKCRTEYQGFKIDTVEINAQISAEGRIGFMGTNFGLTGTGGISFLFKKI